MAPVTIILCIIFLTKILGWAAILGCAILIASLPFQTLTARWYVKLQKDLLEVTDARLNLAVSAAVTRDF